MLAIAVLLPFLGALLVAPLERRAPGSAPWVAGGVATLALVLVLASAGPVFDSGVVQFSWPWMPQLGLSLTFRLDGLSLLFALLVLAIGVLVVLYARYYLSADEPKGRFYGFLLLFMGAMLGLVMSGNLLLMVMFWELTSLSSFLLIGFWNHRSDARQGARLALMITGGGGLALLGGVLLLGHIVGSFELDDVLAAGEVVKSSPMYVPAMVLILLGAFTKSAQFPFHFWLPHAMAAPTPVSAYLHSATMVKAGVFLLARLFPVLAGTDIWFVLVGGTGLVTLLFGAYTALFQHDLKGLLAYSTISHLGLITLLFGLGTPLGEVAAVFHIINHATFKASLFMAAGIIDHEAGSRDMRKLNGLFKYMPYTAVLAMVASGAMAGVPLLNGFLSKEMFFGETLELAWMGWWNWLVPLAATLGGVFAVAYSARFIHDVFFNGEPVGLTRTPHEPPRWMKVPVELLVVACVLVGIFPQYTVGPLLEVATHAVAGRGVEFEYDLAIWHGFNLPLLMSVIALVGGVMVYMLRHQVFALHDRLFPPLRGKDLADDHMGWLLSVSEQLTGRLENGSLQRYMLLLVISALVVGAVPFLLSPPHSAAVLSPVGVGELVTGAVLILAAVATAVLHRQRLLAVILSGVVGLAVALAFVRLAAPDLALTQLLIEVVTVILVLLAMYFLPQSMPADSSPGRRLRDLIVAILVGLGGAGLTWVLITRPFETLSRYYLEMSVPGGGGYNVVNVILVDFRGFDTLGEATVLTIAALAIYALLERLRLPLPDTDADQRPWVPAHRPVILAMTSRPLLPVALLVAVYLLLRGHNAPGGGFIAGLVTSTALILQYMASGSAWARSRLLADYRPVVGVGVLLAGLTGVASWLFGAPFLTTTFTHLNWPLVGEFEVASAMMFDIGVYLVVVTTVLLILAELAQLAQRQVQTTGDR